jgi:hypothetical protein
MRVSEELRSWRLLHCLINTNNTACDKPQDQEKSPSFLQQCCNAFMYQYQYQHHVGQKHPQDAKQNPQDAAEG